MLSILIPTYNYVCAHLVCELQKQCEEVQALLGQDFCYEIIVADDASTDSETVKHNAVIEYLPHCRYIESERNVGRAAIRNRLLDESKGSWLLLIDADAEVITDDFVLKYMQATKVDSSHGLVYVGGIRTPAVAEAGCELRHRYEMHSQQIRTLEARRKHPDAFFSTFNFMANRQVFDVLRFDERCTSYGYEDALFGIELGKYGFSINHIDNPLQHNGINSNADFLANSETALRTLHMLGSPMTDRARVALAARRIGVLRPFCLLLFKLCKPLLRWQLLSKNPNLKIFAFYKLGYYLSL